MEGAPPPPGQTEPGTTSRQNQVLYKGNSPPRVESGTVGRHLNLGGVNSDPHTRRYLSNGIRQDDAVLEHRICARDHATLPFKDLPVTLQFPRARKLKLPTTV